MRNKKVIALAMAAIVGMASAPAVYINVIVAEADETESTGSLKFAGFWSGHSYGDEITETSKTVNFKSKSDADVMNNWQTPCFVLYYGSENKVNGADYAEVGVVRSDVYAWFGAYNTIANITELNAQGITFNVDSAPEDWGAWVAANKEGVDVSYTTQIKDGKAIFTVDNNGAKSTTTFNVQEGKKLYVSVSGENCEVSGLPTSLVTGEAEPTVAPTEVPAEPATSPSISTEPAVTEEHHQRNQHQSLQ